jgi:hypothetical protein
MSKNQMWAFATAFMLALGAYFSLDGHINAAVRIDDPFETGKPRHL